MSVEILRRAASLLRERAKAATDGPWEARPGINFSGHVGRAGLGDGARPFIRTEVSADAEHIASLDPTVANALADWLEAESHEPEVEHEGGAYTTGGPSLMALRLARAYLGEANS